MQLNQIKYILNRIFIKKQKQKQNKNKTYI